jgi:hypothetical protein
MNVRRTLVCRDEGNGALIELEGLGLNATTN